MPPSEGRRKHIALKDFFFCTCTLLGDGDAWYYNTRQYNSGDWAIQYIRRDFKPIFAVKKNIYESYSR